MELARESQQQQVDGAGHGPWSREALLLAEVIDTQNRLIYVITRVLGGKGSEPDRYPRPGVLSAHQRAQLVRPESVERVLELEEMRKAHAKRRAEAGLDHN